MHLVPGTFLTVDEDRIKAHPKDDKRLTFNHNKPDRWAVECHTLHDVETSYLYNFDRPKENTAFDSLHKLITCLSKRNKHHITADKHFSNVPQVEKLDKNGFYFTINCKADAKPSELWKGGLGVGLGQWTSRWARKKNIVAATFQRKGVLNLLSNFFNVTKVSQSGAEMRRIMLDHYDATKRGADQFNELVANFHDQHRHSTLELTILQGWIEWGITNGYILYHHNNKTPRTHRNYLMYISSYLLQ